MHGSLLVKLRRLTARPDCINAVTEIMLLAGASQVTFGRSKTPTVLRLSAACVGGYTTLDTSIRDIRSGERSCKPR